MALAAACLLVAAPSSAGGATAAPTAGQSGKQPLVNEQLASAVAFDGTNYLVVWQGSRDAPYRIYGSRVSRDGTVLDPSGITISSESGTQTNPAVAFDGNDFLVVWEADGDIHGALVTRAGRVLNPAIVISATPNAQRFPAVAFDGTNYLVTWQDDRSGGLTIYGARVSPAASVLDPGGIPISGSFAGLAPALAFDGTNYLVAWYDIAGAEGHVYGARVSRGGSVLDASPIVISSGSQHPQQPSVAFDGTNYFVVWEQGQASFEVYGARVTQAGAVLDPGGVNICDAPGEQQRPKVAFAGGNYVVVWDDARSGNSDIFEARVSPGGNVLDPCGRQVTFDSSEQLRPAVAFDGTNVLAVWEDARLGTRRIFGARITQNGPADQNGILISTELPPAPPPPPASGDTQRPHVHALKSKGRRGHYARLRYRAWDNSKVTREAIVVLAGRRPVAAGQTKFSRSVRGVVYVVSWRVPRKPLRKVTFCVIAEDQAGNRSGVSCAKVVIS